MCVMKRRNLLALFVTALGCAQMVGYLTGAKTVGACGAVSCVAPMAEVFSELRTPGGLVEPFALEFTLRGVDRAGGSFERVVTPELLAGVEGPRARRAVYGAAFATGSNMSVDGAGGRRATSAWENAWCFGFGAHGPLKAAFDLPEGAHALAMTVETRTKGRDEAWVLSPACTR